ncbi:MAG: RNA methyltransferase [Bacteroidetes bacterium]|jgi:tRNA (guanosine-2'-O-)-methyltransferase|nr:RNA methyltransferase [Bacteroidota bacterium]
MRTDERLSKLRTALRRRQPDLTVVMENIHDPHNVSAMLRSCDAVGVLQVHLVYTHEAFPDIGAKSSASARKWVERMSHRSVADCYDRLRAEGFAVYATRLDPTARSLYDLDLTKPTAFVFGNEHRGVSDEAAERSDGSVMIPMMGMIQSLNVSVACAVSLFEAARQRIIAGAYDAPNMSQDELDRLLKVWAMKE